MNLHFLLPAATACDACFAEVTIKKS